MYTTKQRFSKNGITTISTANSNLNGSGSLGQVYVSSLQGSVISSVIVKAISNTTEGMVRLFIYDGVKYYLWKEIYIPANNATSVNQTFQTVINDTLVLDTGSSLMASTENSEPFNILANGFDWSNCECSTTPNCDSQWGTANTGVTTVSTANANRDGTGAISTLITAPSTSSFCGTEISRFFIKSTSSNQEGIISLYLNDGSSFYLFWEIWINANTQTNVEAAYGTINLLTPFQLSKSMSIGVSTQKADNFNVLSFAYDIFNCDCPN